MKSWKKPTNETIGKALASVRKEIDRRYFFSRLNNPLWLGPLAEWNYFKSPPPAIELPDGSMRFPFWPELQYLKNISGEAPDEVARVVLDIPEVDNPAVYQDILDIALNLPGRQSSMLKSKVLNLAQMEPRYLPRSRFQNLLTHWAAEEETSAALELCHVLVRFEPDPESRAKRKRRQEHPDDWTTVLEPAPRFDEWDYKEILAGGVRPLAETVPYEVASILLGAAAEMIWLRRHPDLDDDEDYSQIWCPRLDGKNDRSEQPEEALVHTLGFACERVFEQCPDSIGALDDRLRSQRWKVFGRLRQHLYSRYLNEQTKLWIQESILEHDDYVRREHHFEFQRMVRRSCENFGAALLTDQEWRRIFEAILSGPPKERYREWLGEQFTEDKFKHRRRYFHRMQLRPFSTVLFGEYASYFQELEEECDAQVSDEDYLPHGERKGGWVAPRSPLSTGNLGNLQDEQLLRFINEWEDEHRDEGDWRVEVNIDALAEAFQTVFRESVIPEPERLGFWIENRERVERPIFIRKMIQVMGEEIKAKDFSRLGKWLGFCEWVLSHPDHEAGEGSWPHDKSRDDPNWHDSRRAVGDFVGTCLDKEVDVPISAREQLVRLLEMLSTQFDWRLDDGQRVSLHRNEPLVDAINNTRSRALEDLVNFGFWLRRYDPEAGVSSVTMILDKRFDTNARCRLTTPEYAILGRSFVNFLSLDERWSTEHKSDFFPRGSLLEWLEAFGNLLVFSGPNRPTFEVLREDFDFALNHISDFGERKPTGRGPRYVLGEHLFRYYLWNVYPLQGEGSLLERYYEQTSDERKHWAALFDNVGRGLSNSRRNLEVALKNRATAFFEWRLEVGEPTELREFTFWLRAECLDADWRLDACSKVLDVCRAGNVAIKIWEEVLPQMLPAYTAKVVECFSKLAGTQNSAGLDMRTEDAKAILKAGIESDDEGVRLNAERAREALLRKGRLDLFELDD